MNMTRSGTTMMAPTLASVDDYTGELASGALPWLEITVGLGATATLAAIATAIIHKCKEKKSKYVVAITRKRGSDSEDTNAYLSPRMLNDPGFDSDFDSDDVTVQAVNYDNYELDRIQGRPLPDIPVTPTGVTYDHMELESIDDDSEQAATYDHLILDSLVDDTLGPLPDAPRTPSPDTEDS